MDENPCECGCGQEAGFWERAYKSQGHKKGDPKRFVHGHNARGPMHYNWKGGRRYSRGYVEVLLPDHPRASGGNGYVREHILIAERALGRTLPPDAEIHHVNGDRSDNRRRNLVICPNRNYHALLHLREKAYRACGEPSFRKCIHCQKYDDPTQMYVLPTGEQAWHRSCRNAKDRERRKAKQADHEAECAMDDLRSRWEG